MKKVYIWLISTVIALFVIIGAAFAYFSHTVKQYETSFYPNVKIDNVNISSLTKKEAAKKVAKVTNQYNQITLTVKVKEKEYTKQLKEIGVQYNLDQTLDKAYEYGKDKKLLKKYALISNGEGKNYPLSYTFDPKLLDSWISSIEKDILVKPTNASISIRNGDITVTNDKKGFEIDKQQVKQELTKALEKNNKDHIVVTAAFHETKAPITKSELQTVRKKIGTFTTSFSPNDLNRNTNIKVATKTIDSYLLMPGQSFSFNEFVGDTTADKGYKAAGSYLNGKVVDSLGGGVCQVSTTLYNAIIKAGIIPDVRSNHSMPVGYVPIGQDAAIAYPYKDLKFTNNYDSPVYIEGVSSPTSVTFSVYAANDTKADDTTYQLSSSIVSKDANTTKSVTYLETLKNGKVTDRKQLSKDSYAMHK